MRNRSIKTVLPNLVSMMIMLFLLWILPVNFYIQRYMQHQGQQNHATEMFGQLEQLINTNDEELIIEEAEFKKGCIRAADTIAYHMKKIGKSFLDVSNSKELAEKMNVDEIHFFNPQGKIISGTHPQYYGYTFNSGEQMKFFAPMLHDRRLKLCQDIVPNTAENKEMQYAAVWLDDGSGIVQIGMEPRRLLQRMAEKSLSKVIDGMPFDVNGYFHVLDKNTYEIVASTAKNSVGLKWFEKEDLPYGEEVSETLHRDYQGKQYCIYTKEYEDYVLVRMYDSVEFLQNLLKSSGMVIAFVLCGAVVIVMVLRWYIQRKLSNNLAKVVDELQKIEQGTLDDITVETGITEFEDLLFYINQMLNSIRLKQKHFMHLLNKSEIPVGFFEKNTFYKQTFFNHKLLEILGIEEYEILSLEKLDVLIEGKIAEIEKNLVSQSDKIYKYISKTEKYLQFEKVVDEQSTAYYVVDITDFWEEANQIKKQSQLDMLTSLYNRRGFYEYLYYLFEKPENLGFASMIMLDTDGLKTINDTYGHYMGDRYLKAIGDALKNVTKEHGIASRLGGDEYALFLYGFSSREELERAIHEIEDVRGKVFMQEKTRSHTLQFSMGYVIYPEEGTDFHALIRIADERMYQDKKTRKSKR